MERLQAVAVVGTILSIQPITDRQEKSASVCLSAHLTQGKQTQQTFRFLFALLVLDDVLAGRSNNVAG